MSSNKTLVLSRTASTTLFLHFLHVLLSFNLLWKLNEGYIFHLSFCFANFSHIAPFLPSSSPCFSLPEVMNSGFVIFSYPLCVNVYCLLKKKQLPVDQFLTGNASPVGIVSGSYYLKERPQRFMSTLQLTQV